MTHDFNEAIRYHELHGSIFHGTQQAVSTSSWSIKVSIPAQKFATSILISTPLKSVSIEYLEQDVAYLNERVFIETMYHLLTNCSQSILPTMVCRLNLLVLNASLVNCEGLCYQSNESFAKSGMLKSMFLYDQGRSTACDWLKGLFVGYGFAETFIES